MDQITYTFVFIDYDNSSISKELRKYFFKEGMARNEY